MVLKIHLSLLLAILYNLYIGKKKVFFIAYLFIIMHELAHMIMAVLLKVDIKEIILLPFGTTAKYAEKISLKQEFWISIAGPLATLLFAYAYHDSLYWNINLLILFFNLIPIYPLDGGRILKVLCYALLKEKWGKKIHTFFHTFFLLAFLSFTVIMVVNLHSYSFIFLCLYIFKMVREEWQKEKMLNRINYLQMRQ